MLTFVQEFHNKIIPDSDLCIIGSGPAGIEIANCFKNSDHSVTLLEAGYLDFDWRTQQLHRFVCAGDLNWWKKREGPYGLKDIKDEAPHIRQFGGTLNVWGGTWKILDPCDFREKSYCKEAAWPFSREELMPYYSAIAKDYDVLKLLLEDGLKEKLPVSVAKARPFSPTIAYREKPVLNIRTKFLSELEKASNIRIVLGANVVNLDLTENLKCVKSVTVRSLEGSEWEVKSKFYILASGTIENARLLLCSNRQIKTGIGNGSDLVGRYLMDHPKGSAGLYIPPASTGFLPEAFYHYSTDRKRYRIGISLNDKLLNEYGLPNHYVQLCAIDKKKPSSVPLAYGIDFYLDQIPNRENRVALSEELDELKTPVAKVDWKITGLDRLCFKSFVETMSSLVRDLDLGTMVFKEGIYEMGSLIHANHQMGTTRMAKNAEAGVVDPNCKVFGVENLYISGSSVFPSGGNANPTFTILALSRRLASHLKENLPIVNYH